VAIADSRAEQFDAEIQRRISRHLETVRDTAPDGPALGLEDLRALEQGFAWEILHEPGWEDVRSSWRDTGTYEEFEEAFGPRSEA